VSVSYIGSLMHISSWSKVSGTCLLASEKTILSHFWVHYVHRHTAVSTDRDSKQIVWNSLLWPGDVARHVELFNWKVDMGRDLVSPYSFILEPVPATRMLQTLH